MHGGTTNPRNPNAGFGAEILDAWHRLLSDGNFTLSIFVKACEGSQKASAVDNLHPFQSNRGNCPRSEAIHIWKQETHHEALPLGTMQGKKSFFDPQKSPKIPGTYERHHPLSIEVTSKSENA